MNKTARDISITVILMMMASIVVYWAESRHLYFSDLFLYLYFAPIVFAAFRFYFAGAVYTSFIVASLYAPVLFNNIENEGLGLSVIEQIATILLFMLMSLFLGLYLGHEESKKQEYKGFSDLGKIISFAVSLDDLLPAFLGKVVETTNSTRGAIAFIDHEKKYFTCLDNEGGIYKYKNKPGFIFTDLLSIKKVFYINNLKNDKRLSITQGVHCSSLLVSPIIVKDKNIGLIVLEDKKEEKRYLPNNASLVFGMASQLGAHVTHLKLYDLAIMDGLTRTYTNRFFKNQLKESLESCPVGLLFIDIDHFKSINDTYGHQEGDVVLKAVAGIIRDVAGDRGFVCRYGGEEFGVIVPTITKDDLIVLAELVRTKISSNDFILKNKNIKVTVSIGVSYASNSMHPQDMIEVADQNLYKAKEYGRNRVCSEQPSMSPEGAF